MSHNFATTSRLTIRGYRDSDLPRVLALWGHPLIQKTGPGNAVPFGPKMKDEIPKRVDECVLWIVYEARPGEVPHAVEPDADLTPPGAEGGAADMWVGMCELCMTIPKNRTASLGICMEPRWWGKGYGTEIMRWVLEHAFSELGLHRVTLGANADNERAVKMYQKLGFRIEGREQKSLWQGGKWNDQVTMAILEEEWAAIRGQDKQ